MGILNPILPDPARETKTPWAPFPPGIMDFNNPPRRSYIGRSPVPAPTIDCPDWKEWPFLTRKEDAQAFTQERKKKFKKSMKIYQERQSGALSPIFKEILFYLRSIYPLYQNDP